MLRSCTKQEYRTYADFVYDLARDPAKSGYPSYSDGIKTKAMFLERAEKAFSRETEGILLFAYEGAVEGWIHYYFLPEDKYLSTVSFNIRTHTEIALEEFLAWAQERFHGYELYLGYARDNKAAVAYLSSHGFSCIEEDYNNTAFLHRWEPCKRYDGVVRITKNTYERFAALHRQVEGDMYWNSERIYGDFDNWIILAKVRDGEALGSVYARRIGDGWFEIFGVDTKGDALDPALLEMLLGEALHSAKELGGEFMTFFCGKQEQEIARKLGFTCVGEYVCYKKQLI